jgi:hypothetical protein
MSRACWFLFLVAFAFAPRDSPAASKLPRCHDPARFGPDRDGPPYPCHAGWSWNLTLGPFAGYRFGQSSSGGHYGGEISLFAGPLIDDGAHASFRSYILAAVLDLGYLSSPGAFRAGLEGQISNHYFGVSVGPFLRAGAGETVAGGSITVWGGLGLIAYGRFSLEPPVRPFGELGAMLKIPVRWGG